MQLLRVAVFYDGSYFRKGNVYFKYTEDRGWISFPALHGLFEKYIAEKEKVSDDAVRIVEAHYYDGRLSAEAASGRAGDQLEKDRAFELSLIDEGIVPHYLPTRETGEPLVIQQKGVDVNIALDCLDLAHAGRYDVAILFSGDEDFVPVARKVTSLGKRVLLAHYDFPGGNSSDGRGYPGTYASNKLKRSVSYCVNLNAIVKEADWDAEVRALFFKPRERAPIGGATAGPRQRVSGNGIR